MFKRGFFCLATGTVGVTVLFQEGIEIATQEAPLATYFFGRNNTSTSQASDGRGFSFEIVSRFAGVHDLFSGRVGFLSVHLLPESDDFAGDLVDIVAQVADQLREADVSIRNDAFVFDDGNNSLSDQQIIA